jgi:DNA polymerase-3 subunit delta'
MTLPGTESQPHAGAVLGPALPPDGEPSHAYLFHGPPGSGKRRAARAFAASLLAGGAGDQALVADRVARETHPDLTWVRPTGAAEMLVGDIDEPVVAAATRTPFEAARRVFVIEGADAMNDRAANRLLKTLEEPPSFAHLILLADRCEDVLPTILSRCQLVRFDPPTPAAIERLLRQEGSLEPQTAAACARLALGDAELARRLAGPGGTELRSAAHALIATALHGGPGPRPWGALLDAASAAGATAGEQVTAAVAAELEMLPAKERRRREREGTEAARRAERRRRTRALDDGLRLAELWLRDMLCLADGAPELIHALDELDALQADLAALDQPARLHRAIELVGQTRLSLAQNVTEELALEALCYRLASAVAG